MSADLATRIQLGLDELLEIKDQMSPLIARTGEQELSVMETAAACAMLHSFYTEIEKVLKMVAINWDKRLPSSESWHRDLLTQMAAGTETRPPVITIDLVARLAELPAFRHLFRGAWIALMRWGKLSPFGSDQFSSNGPDRAQQIGKGEDGEQQRGDSSLSRLRIRGSQECPGSG